MAFPFHAALGWNLSLFVDDNTGKLSSAYPVAASTEQHRLNTYMHSERVNEIKKKKMFIY